MISDKLLLNQTEAARYLGVSRQRVIALEKEGRINRKKGGLTAQEIVNIG